MSKRENLLQEANDLHSETFTYNGTELEAKALRYYEQKELQEDVKASEDLDMTIGYILKCIYDPDTDEQVFKYPTDAQSLSSAKPQFLDALVKHALRVNGVQVSDDDVEVKKSRAKRLKSEQTGTPKDTNED